MSSWFVLSISILYIAFLFAIAWYGDRKDSAGSSQRRSPVLYTLSLGVYCTSWTFYGAVGRAASDGWGFFAIYAGPIAALILGRRVLEKMVRIAKSENVVSIADFIAARYGKSQALAALVTVTAVVGLMPYVALQLKAITISFEALVGHEAGGLTSSLPGGTTLLTAVSMAVFAILFGIRTIHANEHHRGLMLAVAAESVVKLGAAVAVGFVIAVGMTGGVERFAADVAAHPRLAELLWPDFSRASWWTACLLAALAIICLPRQFHVAVVENTHEADTRVAARYFPLYLVAINVFVLPVALAGLLRFGAEGEADTFLISISVSEGSDWLALTAFVGGLSAATSMVIVEVVTLSTMVCNDVVVPLLMLRRRDGRVVSARSLLTIRRMAVFGILALGYWYYGIIGSVFPLASIGLLSFGAVAQYAPALLIGLYWRRATAAGVISGIAVGFIGWTFTMLLPSFAEARWIDGSFLPPPIEGLDRLTSAVLCSLGANLLAFIGVSLATRQPAIEREQAERFVHQNRTRVPEPSGARPATLGELRDLAARYVGDVRADAAFRQIVANRLKVGVPYEAALLGRCDSEARQATERLLSGAIGSASARVVVAGLMADRRLSRSDARSIIDEASRALLAQHDLLRATLENVGQGICVFDSELRVATWNRRFLELLDIPDSLVAVGTPLAEIVHYNRRRGEYGQNGEVEDLLARRTAQERAGRADVYERLRPDGTVLEVATNPMPDGGFVAVYTDVTDRHRFATALLDAKESLERRIEERTRDLAAAKAEAERANQGKTRFLAAASHDLLQPLHAARLFLSALAARVSDPLIGQTDASLRSVEHLLGDLLDVSKFDTGIVKPNLTSFAISDVLFPLGEEFAVLARQHGLGLRVVRSSCAVRSDPVLLRRILQNFLANAVRYTPTGRILLGCRRRGDVMWIQVWDTGPGIPEDRLGEIFVEFRQIGAPVEARGRGLGLGLAIVERLAAILAHPVVVRSQVGRGSCFAIGVPLAVAAERAVVPAPPRAGRSLKGSLVLCLDNEAAILEATRELLNGWHCEVAGGTTVQAALDDLCGRIPDAIITDYHLGVSLTGIDALAEFEARLGRRVPAAIVTADRGDEVRAAAAAAGCALAYKPIRPGALRALVGELLAKRRRAAVG
ncbi:PAS domain-containing hybrid sensor histidine kinase/response regulator [Arenibaculum pallidiluteum]|uniref:PAS domain-containing hybrid sensor histidine kinase/response regulator n=1 Tax=Arenibaculum pallidiluteum TaxID=2812559 RepID=UPI001A975034|nr:NahK/ErcS family hybrid sensor histidine kinase/response regulator [Arenibaculum pallidiluteum]